jgi:hypothetical protein
MWITMTKSSWNIGCPINDERPESGVTMWLHLVINPWLHTERLPIFHIWRAKLRASRRREATSYSLPRLPGSKNTSTNAKWLGNSERQ